jgi:NADPH:quinone reductase-like Zn-dependent oxidoreductase
MDHQKFLQLREIEKPTPRDNEVLVKVIATTVTIGDTIMRSFNLHGLWLAANLRTTVIWAFSKPKRTVLGMEISGEIEAVGKAVTRLGRVIRFLHQPSQ